MYLQKIDEYDQNGEITKYTLILKRGGNDDQEFVIEKEYQQDAKIILSQEYTATVRGYTSKGASPPSVITLKVGKYYLHRCNLHNLQTLLNILHQLSGRLVEKNTELDQIEPDYLDHIF